MLSIVFANAAFTALILLPAAVVVIGFMVRKPLARRGIDLQSSLAVVMWIVLTGMALVTAFQVV